MSHRIPFNRPYMTGRELHYIAQVVTTAKLSGDGEFTRRCSELLEERFEIHKVLLTPSCSAALEMAALLCGVGPGDEVIVPSYTFVTSVSSFVRAGAKPVFVDIRPDSLNLDDSLVEEAITPRTKAIVAVHYAGVGAELERLCTIARKHGLLLIEDAAQGVNAFYQDRPLGSIGDLGTYSFHDTKNYVCGEGGALCINSPELVEQAEIIREKGTDRSRFFRGQVDKYTWVEVGGSYVPSEICSAFLLAQLEELDPIRERRLQLCENYRAAFEPLEESGILQLPQVPEGCQPNGHMFYILLPDLATRQALIEYLRLRDISAVFHYVPLHLSPVGRQFGYTEGSLPVTEDLSSRVLRLPLYFDLTEDDQQLVIDLVSDFMTSRVAKRPVVATKQ